MLTDAGYCSMSFMLTRNSLRGRYYYSCFIGKEPRHRTFHEASSGRQRFNSRHLALAFTLLSPRALSSVIKNKCYEE